MYPFELSGKIIFCKYLETKSNDKKTKRTRAKRVQLCQVPTIQVMVDAGQNHNVNQRGLRFMLGSQRSYHHDKKNHVSLKGARASGEKNKCQSG